MHSDLGWDLRPEAGVAHRHHGLLGVAVHMHVQHEAAERSPQVVGQAVIKHAAQDQIHWQLAGDLVDGQVLPVQTHFGEKVELVPAEPQQEQSVRPRVLNVSQGSGGLAVNLAFRTRAALTCSR